MRNTFVSSSACKGLPLDKISRISQDFVVIYYIARNYFRMREAMLIHELLGAVKPRNGKRVEPLQNHMYCILISSAYECLL